MSVDRRRLPWAAAALVPALAGGVALLASTDRPPLREPEYEVTATVLEDGSHGPELCVGLVLTSDPPQCDGLPLTGWSWDAVSGKQSRSGTTWATVHVRGRYDGDRFAPTAPPGEPRPIEREPAPDFSPACARPEVVDPAHGMAEWEEATQRWGLLPELVAGWVSNAAAGEAPFVGNLVVRPGAAPRAREAVRRFYTGPLCLVERDQRTAEELGVLYHRALRTLGEQVVFGGTDERRGVIEVTVVLVTPTLRADLDRAVGPGVVKLRSRLTPAD